MANLLNAPMDIFEPIENHDLQRLEELLAAGANPNAPHPNSPAWVPLKQAVEELVDGGPIEAIVLLLRSGADVDGGREPGNATPLTVAVMNKQLDAVLHLLTAGADPNNRDDEGDTPLSLSLRNQKSRLETALRLCGATDVVK